MRSSPRSLALRVLVTLAAPVVSFAVAPLVPLPVVGAWSPSQVGVFGLGIVPIVSAYALVAIAALVFPRLAKLERAAGGLVVVLAGIQAFGIARALGVDALGALPTSLVVASLVGGTCVVFLVASFVTRLGIANGIVLLTLASLLVEMHHGVAPPLRKALRFGILAPKDVVVAIGALAVSAAATWIALRRSVHRPQTDSDRDPYRAGVRTIALRPTVPVPASSLAAFWAGTSLVSLATSFQPMGPSPKAALDLVLTLGLGYALAWLLHRPRDTAALVAMLGGAHAEQARDDGRRALARAMPATLLYLAVLVMASHAFGATRIGRGSMLVAPLLVALVMDLAGAIRARAGASELVSVFQERRVEAVSLVASVLAAEGIEVRTRGVHVLGLLQAFAPYAPGELLVRADDAPRATAILRHLFLGESAPARREAEPLAREASPPPATIAWRTRRLLAVAAIAAGLLGLATAKLPAVGSAGPRAQLAVVRVDDATDPFAAVHDERVPEGIELFEEAVPTGTSATERRTFAKTMLRPGETFDAAVARMKPWLATIAVPPGERFAFEPVSEIDDARAAIRIVGARTYLLTGDPVLTTADVTSAEPMIDDDPSYGVYVAVTLAPDAADRFGEATRAWIHRRLAIVVDGTISSAPVVRSAIFGGRISITLGRGDPDEQILEAKRLAERLAGR